MGQRFRTTTFADIEPLTIDIDGQPLQWRPVRRTLGIQAFGTNAYTADRDQLIVEPHDEQRPGDEPGHQELYVVITGRARFTIDGETFEAPAGTLVFLPEPEARREAYALEDGTTVMAVGAQPGVPFQVSEWEDRFVAEARAATEGDGSAA